jgi:hypothetical protein
LPVRSFAGISLRHKIVMSLATTSATYIQKSVTYTWLQEMNARACPAEKTSKVLNEAAE